MYWLKLVYWYCYSNIHKIIYLGFFHKGTKCGKKKYKLVGTVVRAEKSSRVQDRHGCGAAGIDFFSNRVIFQLFHGLIEQEMSNNKHSQDKNHRYFRINCSLVSI